MICTEGNCALIRLACRLNASRSTPVRKNADKTLRVFRHFPSIQSTMGAAPPYPRQKELPASPVNCARPCPQSNGCPSHFADKMGGMGGEATVAVWPKASRRSGSGAPHRKSNSSRSALVRARSERPNHRVRCHLPCHQFNGHPFNSLATNPPRAFSPPLSPMHRMRFQSRLPQFNEVGAPATAYTSHC